MAGPPPPTPSVALGPVEIAGVSSTLAPALRARGHDVTVALFAPHPFGYPCDRVVSGYARRAAFGLAAPLRHRVLHYQFATTWLGFLDAVWAGLWRRPRLMHYHGDDCRLDEIAKREHPARGRVTSAGNDAYRRRWLRVAARTCSAAIVADLELLSYVRPFFDRVYLLPLAVELGPAPSPAPPRDGPLVVAHAPSDPRIKGTDAIREAVAAVPDTRLDLLTGMSHDEVLSAIRSADVVIDQLNSVTYGVVAVEAMSAGRPVLCEYDPARLASWCDGLPIVRVSPETVADRLRALAGDAGLRRSLGAAGRAFTERVNDPARVAEATARVYEHVAARPPAGVYEATAEEIRHVA